MERPQPLNDPDTLDKRFVGCQQVREDRWRWVDGNIIQQNDWLTVQVFGLGVVYVDYDDFPVRLSFINHGQNAEHFHFDYLPTWAHLECTF